MSRTLLVLPRGEIFGAESMALELLAETPPDAVAVAAPIRSALGRAAASLGHQVHDFALPLAEREGARFPLTYVRALDILSGIVRAEHPSLLHGISARSAKVVGPVAYRTGTPAVLSVHEVTSAGEIGMWRARAQRVAARPFDLITAVSEYVRSCLAASGYPPGKLRLLRNGWSRSEAPLTRSAARRLLGLPADPFVFLLVGRVCSLKGQHIALDAFDILLSLRRNTDALLVLVGGPMEGGDAAYTSRIAERAARSGGRVVATGYSDQVETYFDAADVVLVPSTRPDAFPTVVLQAGAAGRPVVVSDQGGAPEAVIDGVTGWVRSAEPGAFAAAMSASLSESWCRRAGAAGHRHIEVHFSRHRFATETAAIWDELSGSSSRYISSKRAAHRAHEYRSST